MTIARLVTVTGRVQGVFFRAWTQQQAQSAGVSGWVRNRPDGSVEAQLEGSEPAVLQMIDRMREGPSGAQVEDFQVSECPVEGLGRFDVRH